MERILITQNETNNNTDYLVFNGEVVEDSQKLQILHEKVVNAFLLGETLYKKGGFTLKKEKDVIVMQSAYETKDIGGRNIFYMFYIENFAELTIDDIIAFLQKDSETLNRVLKQTDEGDINASLQSNKDSQLMISRANELVNFLIKNKWLLIGSLLVVSGGNILYKLMKK